jgi:hypothetical protein
MCHRPAILNQGIPDLVMVPVARGHYTSPLEGGHCRSDVPIISARQQHKQFAAIGARMRVFFRSLIRGQPRRCGGLGSPKPRRN